jgi:hypothetical protein
MVIRGIIHILYDILGINCVIVLTTSYLRPEHDNEQQPLLRSYTIRHWIFSEKFSKTLLLNAGCSS